ncbi:MAG: inositol monophosphatase family protein [Henriciella sp.]|nr:inositol monophosphatase family protein [Henriciella sp.]
MPENSSDFAEDLAILRDVAKEAGEFAQSFLRRGNIETWDKSKNHPVTEADLAVNELIQARLTAARPDYGWLSEETAPDHRSRSKQRVWVVDPIDGTRAFMRGEPYWCIGMGVLEAGQAKAGVVHAPQLEETYWARMGGGAFLNNVPIGVTDRDAEIGCRIITNEGLLTHPAWPEPWPTMELASPKPNATLIRICWVASGRYDAVLTLWRKSDWDLAPASIIMTEAGGVATTHLGEPFVFNRDEPAQRSLLAAGKPLHSLLSARVKGVKLPDPNWAVRPYDKTRTTEPQSMSEIESKQLLHIVIGGELKDVTGVEFEDLSAIDFVGAFPDYKAAYDAWKGAAQRTVDNAEMRYFILHAHRLLDPETGDHHHV